MSVRDNEPLDVEIDQFHFDKKSATHIAKLQSLESDVMKSLNDVADKMKKANSELQKYGETQREMSRQYIQLINQNSDLIAQKDLQFLKEHINRINQTAENQTMVINQLKELAAAYKEYTNTLKDLGKSWTGLAKTQGEWHMVTAELKKAQSKNTTGEKLAKIEKRIAKGKVEVQKRYSDKTFRQGFVEKAVSRLNQAWQKLKVNIKSVNW